MGPPGRLHSRPGTPTVSSTTFARARCRARGRSSPCGQGRPKSGTLFRHRLGLLGASAAAPEIWCMGQSLRSLAAEVGNTVHECVRQLRPVGLEVVVGKQRLGGETMTVRLLRSIQLALYLSGGFVPPAPIAVEHERHQPDAEHARERGPDAEGDPAGDADTAAPALEAAHDPEDQHDRGDEAEAGGHEAEHPSHHALLPSRCRDARLWQLSLPAIATPRFGCSHRDALTHARLYPRGKWKERSSFLSMPVGIDEKLSVLIKL